MSDEPDVAEPADEDRLPWLEAVEDEDESGPSPLKLIVAVLIGLVAIGGAVSGLYWLSTRDRGGNGEVIASQGDYKMRPTEPGGMQVDNSSSTQVAASTGNAPNASLNQTAHPEAPVRGGQGHPAPAAAPAPTPAPAAQAPARPTPAPAQPAAPAASAQSRLRGPLIQLGAFPSAEVANNEWSRLARRFSFLGSLPHEVTVYQQGNRTFYRLRAGGGEAAAACRRLVSAGVPCIAVPG